MAEIYLNIFMSVILHFFREGRKKVFQFLAVVVCSGSGTTFSLESLKMASFFDDSYPELCRAHATGSERDFNALARKVRPKLAAYAARLTYVRPLGAVGLDDYVQEGLITVWRKITEYRFICPVCREAFIERESFRSHCTFQHGEEFEPVKTLEQWLNRSVKQYMLNHLRDMGRPERKRELTVYNSESVGAYSENTASIRPDRAMFSRMAVEQVEYLVMNERNPKVRMLVSGCLEGCDRSMIWERMAAAGLAKTPKSACVCVNRLMKRREVWRDYRAALV